MENGTFRASSEEDKVHFRFHDLKLYRIFLLPVHYIHSYQNLVEAIVDIRAENMIVTSASDDDVGLTLTRL